MAPLDMELAFIIFLPVSALLLEDRDEADDEALAGREELFQEVVVEEGLLRNLGDKERRGEPWFERKLPLRERVDTFCRSQHTNHFRSC